MPSKAIRLCSPGARVSAPGFNVPVNVFSGGLAAFVFVQIGTGQRAGALARFGCKWCAGPAEPSSGPALYLCFSSRQARERQHSSQHQRRSLEAGVVNGVRRVLSSGGVKEWGFGFGSSHGASANLSRAVVISKLALHQFLQRRRPRSPRYLGLPPVASGLPTPSSSSWTLGRLLHPFTPVPDRAHVVEFRLSSY